MGWIFFGHCLPKFRCRVYVVVNVLQQMQDIQWIHAIHYTSNALLFCRINLVHLNVNSGDVVAIFIRKHIDPRVKYSLLRLDALLHRFFVQFCCLPCWLFLINGNSKRFNYCIYTNDIFGINPRLHNYIFWSKMQCDIHINKNKSEKSQTPASKWNKQ